jgi:hypothetical protein
VTTFQLVRAVSIWIGSAASISSSVGGGGVNSGATSAASHSALVHLGAGRGITFWRLPSIPAHLVPAFAPLGRLMLLLLLLLLLLCYLLLFSCSANRSTFIRLLFRAMFFDNFHSTMIPY